MNLIDAIKLFEAAGGKVSQPRRTGELVFTHPATTRRCRVNGRNKDVTMALQNYLKKLNLWPEGRTSRCA